MQKNLYVVSIKYLGGLNMLVVKSKVREIAAKRKMSFGGDAAAALSREVERVLNRAIERAKENGRKTVKGRDI